MRKTIVLIALLIAGCTHTVEPSDVAHEDLLTTGFPGLPRDARQVAERLASCSHFAGEISGDGSDRYKEIASTMTRLRCDKIDKIDNDASAIRKKYADNPAVQSALRAASEL